MDAIFDASFVVPAVIFTFLAIILATSLFGKKADPKSETIVDDAPIEETAREGEHSQPKAEIHEVAQSEAHRIEEIKAEPESDVPAVAPVVEEMGVLEKDPVIQSEISPAQQESEKIHITDSAPEIVKEFVSQTLSASTILESEPPPLEKEIIPEPMNIAPQVGFAPALKPEPVPGATAEPEPVAQVVLEDILEASPTAAPEPASIPEAAPTAAPEPTSIPEMAPTAAHEPASIPEAPPTASHEPALIPEAAPTAAHEPASIPEAAPEPTSIPEAAPTAPRESTSIPEAAPEPSSIPEAPPVAPQEHASIPEATPMAAHEPESVRRASPTDSIPEPVLDPLSKIKTSISEQVPESAPVMASLEDIQQMAAEPGPAKQEHIDAVVPSSSDGDDEPLKYVPRKLRTSQLEKLMTKEELEEEQRVQQKQLAAIFQLLRDNEETFGEVTEGDVKDQLKLYSK